MSLTHEDALALAKEYAQLTRSLKSRSDKLKGKRARIREIACALREHCAETGDDDLHPVVVKRCTQRKPLSLRIFGSATAISDTQKTQVLDEVAPEVNMIKLSVTK